MRKPGILGTIQLAAVLAFVVPLLLFGAEAVVRGRVVLGVAFVGLAAVMLGLQWWLTNPLDPVDVTEAAVEWIAGDREE